MMPFSATGAAAGRANRRGLPHRRPVCRLILFRVHARRLPLLLPPRSGRVAEAEPLYVEALAARREVLGNRHPDTLLVIHNLALLLSDAGRFAEAEPLVIEALTTRRETLGDRHPETLRSMNNLANLLCDAGAVRCLSAQAGCRSEFRNEARADGNRCTQRRCFRFPRDSLLTACCVS